MVSSISTITTDSTATDKNSVILTSISSTLSMNSTINVITNNSTMIPINSVIISLTWNISLLFLLILFDIFFFLIEVREYLLKTRLILFHII